MKKSIGYSPLQGEIHQHLLNGAELKVHQSQRSALLLDKNDTANTQVVSYDDYLFLKKRGELLLDRVSYGYMYFKSKFSEEL